MADSFIRRGNLNTLCVRLGWVSRRAKQLGSPSELINRLGRSSSFWSGIDLFGDADLWGVGVGFAVGAVCRLTAGSADQRYSAELTISGRSRQPAIDPKRSAGISTSEQRSGRTSAFFLHTARGDSVPFDRSFERMVGEG
jgi:hypothetical protein